MRFRKRQGFRGAAPDGGAPRSTSESPGGSTAGVFTKIGKAVFGHADALKPGDQISFPGHVRRLAIRLFGAVLVAAAIGYGCAGPTSNGVHILIELDGREGASHDDPREKRSAKDASARLPPFGVREKMCAVGLNHGHIGLLRLQAGPCSTPILPAATRLKVAIRCADSPVRTVECR